MSLKSFFEKIKQDRVNADKLCDDESKTLSCNVFSYYKGVRFLKVPFRMNACSFGMIFWGKREPCSGCEAEETLRHEYGHYLQYKKLGFFKYVRFVAAPSLKGYFGGVPYNSYYSQPWEYEADVLGNVMRQNYSYELDAEQKYNEYKSKSKIKNR